jgi:hypothetical protein
LPSGPVTVIETTAPRVSPGPATLWTNTRTSVALAAIIGTLPSGFCTVWTTSTAATSMSEAL